MRADVDVDEVMRALPQFGRWQVSLYATLSWAMVVAGVASINYVFLAWEPDHNCHVSTLNYASNETTALNVTVEFLEAQQCMVLDPSTNTSASCTTGWDYAEPRDRSIVSEWNLVCDKNFLGETSQTLFMVGQAVGSYVFTVLADRYGRKPVYLITHWAFLAVNIGMAFLPNIESFLAFRFLSGTLQQGVEISPYVLAMEIFPVDFRMEAGMGYGFTWAIGLIMVSGIAYGCRAWSWRHLQLLLCALSLPLLHHTFCTDESLRWLFANGKRKEIKALLKKACKINKVSYDDVMATVDQHTMTEPVSVTSVTKDLTTTKDIPLPEVIHKGADQHEQPSMRDEHEDEPNEEAVRYSVLDVLKHRKMRIVFFIMIFAWASNSLMYNGLFLMSGSLAGGRFLNFFLNSVVEIPAYLAATFSMRWFGRKKTLVGFNVLGSLVLVPAMALQVIDNVGFAYVINGLLVTAKLFVSGTFMTLWVYTPEVYPTNLRSLGTGCGAVAARLGGMLAPFTSYLMKTHIWAPNTIFGVTSLIICVLTFWLPETGDKELAQTLEEIDEWEEKGGKEFKVVAMKPNDMGSSQKI